MSKRYISLRKNYFKGIITFLCQVCLFWVIFKWKVKIACLVQRENLKENETALDLKSVMLVKKYKSDRKANNRCIHYLLVQKIFVLWKANINQFRLEIHRIDSFKTLKHKSEERTKERFLAFLKTSSFCFSFSLVLYQHFFT